MNRVRTIARCPSAEVLRFAHSAEGPHCDDGEQVCEAFAASLVGRGTFSLRQKRDAWRFAAGDVLLSYPRERHRYEHREEFPSDVCLSVRYAPEAVEETLGVRTHTPRAPALPPSARSAFHFSRIREAVKDADALALECSALAMIPALFGAAVHGAAAPRLGRLVPLHARRVKSTAELLEKNLETELSLDDLARFAAMSRFSFARIFKDLLGEPPHAYLPGLRLRRARALLRAGCTVTEAAYASGFRNLSHFVRTFRRRYGASPRKFKSVK